ncbi:MAG: hypothetical protein Q4C01_04405 [Clostridia bacterium]|nr:hypothetical protein [Clostridia bacterium]
MADFGGMAGMRIVAEPDLLRAKAEEAEARVAKMRGIWDEVLQTVRGTVEFWNGEAATEHRERFLNCDETVSWMLETIISLTTKMRQVAGVYDTSKQEVGEELNPLPADIIK